MSIREKPILQDVLEPKSHMHQVIFQNFLNLMCAFFKVAPSTSRDIRAMWAPVPEALILEEGQQRCRHRSNFLSVPSTTSRSGDRTERPSA